MEEGSWCRVERMTLAEWAQNLGGMDRDGDCFGGCRWLGGARCWVGFARRGVRIGFVRVRGRGGMKGRRFCGCESDNGLYWTATRLLGTIGLHGGGIKLVCC